MKHVLIPTDFTIKSLQAVKAAAEHFQGERLKITLFHLLELPFGISDILLRAGNRANSKMVTKDFSDACQIIQNKYQSTIEGISTVFGQGNTVAYLSNVLDGLKIDLVVVQQNMQLALPDTRSIDMVPMLYKTKYKIIELPHSSVAEKASFSITDLLVQSNSLS